MWEDDFASANQALLEEKADACRHLYYSLFSGIKEKLKTRELEHATGRYLHEFARGQKLSSRKWQNPFVVFQNVELSDDVRLGLFSSINYQNFLAVMIGKETKNKPTRGHIGELVSYNKTLLSRDLSELTAAELIPSLLAFVYLNRIIVDYKSAKPSKLGVSLDTYYAHVICEALLHNKVEEITLPAFHVRVTFPSMSMVSFKFGFGSPYPYHEPLAINMVKACFQGVKSINIIPSKILPIYKVELAAPVIDKETVEHQFNAFKETAATLPGIIVFSDYLTKELLEKKIISKLENVSSNTGAVLILASITSDLKPVSWYKQILDNIREIPNLVPLMHDMAKRNLLRRRRRNNRVEFIISEKCKKELSKKGLLV